MAKTIILDKVFVKHYKKRILPQIKLHKQYKKMMSLFLGNPYDQHLEKS